MITLKNLQKLIFVDFKSTTRNSFIHILLVLASKLIIWFGHLVYGVNQQMTINYVKVQDTCEDNQSYFVIEVY